MRKTVGNIGNFRAVRYNRSCVLADNLHTKQVFHVSVGIAFSAMLTHKTSRLVLTGHHFAILKNVAQSCHQNAQHATT
jgi:hypothetical protein